MRPPRALPAAHFDRNERHAYFRGQDTRPRLTRLVMGRIRAAPCSVRFLRARGWNHSALKFWRVILLYSKIGAVKGADLFHFLIGQCALFRGRSKLRQLFFTVDIRQN